MTLNSHNPAPLAKGILPRADRVCILVAVAAILNLADLWLTVHFMQTTGMVELNPLARFIAGAGTSGLAVFKGASVLTHAAVLAALRRRRSAEVGAWVSVLALALLTSHWLTYVGASSELTGRELAALACQDHYVKLSP